MKASYCTKYGGPDVYEMVEVKTPLINQKEVLIKVLEAVVSPTDANFRSGKPLISRLFSGVLKPKVKIHGEMFAGIVEEVGNKNLPFTKGDMVYGSNGMSLGAYAEYVSVDVTKNTLKKIPKDINYKNALPLLDGGITALPFLTELGKIKEGDSVLINGASGAVGSMAVMISKHYKATVTGVCSTKNVNIVASLGADHVIDYSKNDFTAQNNKYDIIFDAVAKSSYKKSKKALKATGIYMTTFPSPSVMINSLFKKNSLKKRAGFMAAGLRKPNTKINDLSILEEMLQAGTLTPLHGNNYSLNDLGKAQTYVETGHKVGNVTITIQESK